MTAELIRCEGAGQPISHLQRARIDATGAWVMAVCPTCKAAVAIGDGGIVLDHVQPREHKP